MPTPPYSPSPADVEWFDAPFFAVRAPVALVPQESLCALPPLPALAGLLVYSASLAACCADAFLTFKDLLTRHKPMVAQFLSEHYDDFFLQYTTLLQSDNYVTRRQSLKVGPLSGQGVSRTAGQAPRVGSLAAGVRRPC